MGCRQAGCGQCAHLDAAVPHRVDGAEAEELEAVHVPITEGHDPAVPVVLQAEDGLHKQRSAAAAASSSSKTKNQA